MPLVPPLRVIPVGFGGAIDAGRMVAVANLRSAPVQRATRAAGKRDLLIDLTFGRRARSAVFLDSGHVALVAIAPDTLVTRWRRAVSGLGSA